jgi:O-antigen/teichoic acid export membrane protein
MISALIPAVSELDAREARDAKIKLFLRGSKYLISLSTPVLIFAAANAPMIMLAWMGPGHELASTVIRFLCLGYYLSTVTGVASSIAAGVARTDLDMKFGILMAGLNLLLSVWLIIELGFIGVLIGTTTALTISSLWYVRLFSRYLEVSTNSFWHLFTTPVAACIPPTIAVWAVNYFLYPLAAESGRLLSLFLLAFTILLFFALYAAIILRSSYFDEYDKSVLAAHIPLSRHMFSIYAH